MRRKIPASEFHRFKISCLTVLLSGVPTFGAPPHRIEWQSDHPVLIQAGGHYGRITRVDARTLLACFDWKRAIHVRHSTDEGKTWEEPVKVADWPHGTLTNAELLVLKNGELLCFFNRPINSEPSKIHPLHGEWSCRNLAISQPVAMFKRFWWVFFATAAAGATAGFLAAAIVAYVTPRKYESETVIEVKPTTAENALLGNDQDGSQSGDGEQTPRYLRTAVEEIKSSTTLAKVVENLELINKWGEDKETAVRILKEIVITQNIRESDLISIRVRHTNREDARNITAEVAIAYGKLRNERETRNSEKQLFELRKATRDQADKVEELRKILATIPDPQNSDRNPEPPHEQIIRRGSGPDYADAKRDYEMAKQLLQVMDVKMTGDVIASKLSGDNVLVHEEPQIAQSPVSPNVPLTLMLGTAGGILLSPLLALPLILLLNRLNPVMMDGPPALP